VKDALLHLSLYVLFAVACAAAILLVLLVLGASPISIVPLLGPLLVFAWAVGMIPATLRLLRAGRRPVLTAFVVGCLTAGVVSSGILLYRADDSTPAHITLVSSMSQGTVETGRIYQGHASSIIVEGITGNELQSVVVVDHSMSADTRVRIYPRGYWDRVDNELILSEGPDIALDDLKGFGVPVMPSAIRNTAADVLRLMDTATSLWYAPSPLVDADRVPELLRKIVSPFLIVLVITLLFMVVWVPLRLTRWPLLNVVAGLAYLRGVAALPVVVDRLTRLELVARWIPGLERTASLLVAAGSLILGLALLSLLLPSLSNWRHNMHFQERRS
jgi:hypothetical protein